MKAKEGGEEGELGPRSRERVMVLIERGSTSLSGPSIVSPTPRSPLCSFKR